VGPRLRDLLAEPGVLLVVDVGDDGVRRRNDGEEAEDRIELGRKYLFSSMSQSPGTEPKCP
jgi:hypothetical protein